MISPGSAALLAAQFSSSLQKAAQTQLKNFDVQKDQEVRNGCIIGFITLGNIGEMIATIRFPITMFEKPIFTHGWELGDNQWPKEGAFPVCSATVVKWTTIDLNGTIGYQGAEIAIVVFGFEGMTTLMHYSFMARSFTNPVTTEESLAGEL